MSGWANHIEPIKGTRRRICRTLVRRCQYQRHRNGPTWCQRWNHLQ